MSEMSQKERDQVLTDMATMIQTVAPRLHNAPTEAMEAAVTMFEAIAKVLLEMRHEGVMPSSQLLQTIFDTAGSTKH